MPKWNPQHLLSPVDGLPAADSRPRTRWLKIGVDGPPAYLGVYEVAIAPYKPKNQHVLLMRWTGHDFPFFESAQEGQHLSMYAYSGQTWYRGLANKEDSHV